MGTGRTSRVVLMMAIDHYSYGDYEEIKIPDESAWRTEFGLQIYGFCYTLNISFHMTIYNNNGTLMFGLNDNLTYMVFVHDPNILILTASPSIPIQWFTLKNNNLFSLKSLVVVERHNMVRFEINTYLF